MFLQSEIEGGVFLHDLTPKSTLYIQTKHHWYTLVHCGENRGLISGHPEFCLEPVLARIAGSSWGGSMLKTNFIGRGMHPEFKHPEYETPIVTSRIVEILEDARTPEHALLATVASRRLTRERSGAFPPP
jgi:hypothetical protein